ncbi:hypothetical protein Godav_027395 [Gossypium davidsonii]|uniref:DUF4283 domain-containing protein n=1 Tax=Gossypium davidsonii TaxID=34287 RepID=A0A7J8RWI1_GOSDV|nr:hypothetical protein [Gossypium davidsonii]
MRAILVNVWHPIGGIMIFDLSDGRFQYRLFHKVDAGRIKVEGPWNFNSHLLILRRQIGNFIGQFINYDFKAINFGYIGVLRDDQELSFGWDISLKAPFRRATSHSSRWLREEGGGSPGEIGVT